MCQHAAWYLICLLMVLSTQVSAQSESHIIPWIGISGGFATYAMGDINEEIRNLDAILNANFDEIKQGLGFGIIAGVDLNQRYRFSAQIQKCTAISEVHYNSGSLEYSFPANAYFLSATFLPPLTSHVLVGIGLSGGIVVEDGKITDAVAGEGATTRCCSGVGLYLDAHLSLDLILGQSVSIISNASYRSARISPIVSEGRAIIKDDGRNYSMDYSGYMIQVGLMYRFSKAR